MNINMINVVAIMPYLETVGLIVNSPFVSLSHGLTNGHNSLKGYSRILLVRNLERCVYDDDICGVELYIYIKVGISRNALLYTVGSGIVVSRSKKVAIENKNYVNGLIVRWEEDFRRIRLLR